MRYPVAERNHSMSSHHFHAVIWIDHHEARVFHFSPTDVERLVLHPDHPTKHSLNRLQPLARFSLRDQPMPRPNWSNTSANMIPG